jgi:hypothetical protein
VKIVQLLSTESPDYAKYEHKGSGLFVGVSKTNEAKFSDYSLPDKTNCMHNGPNPTDRNTVIRFKSCEAWTGDVIGVVLDFGRDTILFYVNGELVAKGLSKPSDLTPVYVVAWIFFQGCELEFGDFIPYHTLERN